VSAKPYWIRIASDLPILGPFSSIESAENWIRKDCADTFRAGDICLNELDAESWFEKAIIFQEVKAVRPVPSVKVNIKLERVDE